MRRSGAWFSAVLAVALPLSGADEPKVRAFIGVKKQEFRLPASWARPMPSFDLRQVRWQAASPLNAFRVARTGMPGATVEVWAVASQARQEEMRLLTQLYAPVLQTAFDTGQSASVGGQFLSRLVELCRPHNSNQNPAPATAPAVWYNAQDPWARDPKFWK